MAEKSWSELLKAHSPELDRQNQADREYLNRSSGLSSREKLLLAMVLDAAANRPAGARGYGERAHHLRPIGGRLVAP